MIQPVLQHDGFLNAVKAVPDDSEDLVIWWLGQSGFLIKWQGNHLLFDPYLSDSLTRKYANTDKPHVRMTELVVDPGRLDFLDVVTSSHNHTDHLDRDTLEPLMQVNPDLKVLVPSANRAFAADRLGVEETRLDAINAGESITLGAFTLHAVPAAHENLEQDEQGRHKFVGFVAKFGNWSVYHSGDTMLYDGMEELLAPFNVDVALLPINGRAPERRVAGNLWGDEAARLAKSIGAGTVIPCHYDMFEFNTATPALFVSECERIGQLCAVLENGGEWRCSR